MPTLRAPFTFGPIPYRVSKLRYGYTDNIPLHGSKIKEVTAGLTTPHDRDRLSTYQQVLKTTGERREAIEKQTPVRREGSVFVTKVTRAGPAPKR